MRCQPASTIRALCRAACALLAAQLVSASFAADAAPPALPPGMRQVVSAHLTLITDLPPNPDIDALSGVFDQAFGQWCAYFGVDEREHADWHVRGCLMKSRERFEAAGLAPRDLPNFASGYARGDALWLYDQTSTYYRRHLLLHEGTHAFVHHMVGGVGPPWFAEGMAELLATHRLHEGALALDYFPRSAGEVSKWGRIEFVQNGYAQRHAMSLAKIFAYDERIQSQNDSYGWCWAAAAFLDGHPRYRERFRQLRGLAAQPDFTAKATSLFAEDRPRLNEDWQLFVANLDYGYDFERMNVEYEIGAPLADSPARVSVAADRGWQPGGVRIEQGATIHLRASGRYQVAQEPKPWNCEPGGVTIRYYRGRPLGMLLAAVRADDDPPQGASGLLKPLDVGLEATITADRAGTLYFRVNDSAGSLADNAGSLEVQISSLQSTPDRAARAR
jgi:hypothetical protein